LTEQDELRLADAALSRVCEFLKLDSYAVAERTAILIYDAGENVQAAHCAAVREAHLQTHGRHVDERLVDALLIRNWFCAVGAEIHPTAES
jgi:hypothetical protein